MKRFLLLLALATLSVGCDDGSSLGGSQGLSTEPTVWRGNPGTAVTIRFATGTERLEGAREVGFQGWRIADFTAPVMKLEPRAVTLFFPNESSDLISRLREAISAGTLRVVRCDPDRVCG
jgi:hypothetical protein